MKLITNKKAHTEITRMINNKLLPSLPNLNIDIISIDTDETIDADDCGTADVLRQIYPRIDKNVSLNLYCVKILLMNLMLCFISFLPVFPI